MQALSIRLPEEPKPIAVFTRIAGLPWRSGLKWTGLLLALAVFFCVGLVIGQASSDRAALYWGSANSFVADKFARDGDPTFRERRAVWQYDALVGDFLRHRDHPSLKDRTVGMLNSMAYGGEIDANSEKSARMVREIAEHRLTYFAAPSPASLAEVKRLALEANLARWTSNYEKVARDYSTLLGREIGPDRLLLDADVKGLLKYEKEYSK
ncbi:MAG: hypothetical protein HY255_12405 [Betaproteobacteria bacterium]|nr:hypothetical protein [Betaproteobacteria bacterium]